MVVHKLSVIHKRSARGIVAPKAVVRIALPIVAGFDAEKIILVLS
jgi:hypothetical protein